MFVCASSGDDGGDGKEPDCRRTSTSRQTQYRSLPGRRHGLDGQHTLRFAVLRNSEFETAGTTFDAIHGSVRCAVMLTDTCVDTERPVLVSSSSLLLSPRSGEVLKRRRKMVMARQRTVPDLAPGSSKTCRGVTANTPRWRQLSQ